MNIEKLQEMAYTASSEERIPRAVVSATDGRRYTVYIGGSLRQKWVATRHLLRIIWRGGL